MRPLIYSVPEGMTLRRPGLFKRTVRAVVAVFRLIIPVASMLIIALSADLSTNQPVTWLDDAFRWVDEGYAPSLWLTGGHLIFLLTFFLLALINRRYGLGYSAATVVITFAVAVGGAHMFADERNLSISQLTGLSERTVWVFTAAAFLSLLAGAKIYEIKRGFPWWRAPLLGWLASAVVFCGIFFPGAFWGQDVVWGNYLAVYGTIFSVLSFAALFPYYVLKLIVRPLKGLGYAPD